MKPVLRLNTGNTGNTDYRGKPKQKLIIIDYCHHYTFLEGIDSD